MSGKIKGWAKALPTISRAAYTAALADAEKAEIELGGADVIDRLRRDPEGEALAAVNQLRATHRPDDVLTATIQAGRFAQSIKEMRGVLRKLEKQGREQTDEVARFMASRAAAGSEQLMQALEERREVWESQANICAGAVELLSFPRKMDGENARATVGLRALRDRLFRNARAPHQPLQRLIGVALGETIAIDTVKEALRAKNSPQAKAEFPTPTSGNKGSQ